MSFVNGQSTRLLMTWIRLAKAPEDKRDDSALADYAQRIDDAMLGVMPDEADDRMLVVTSTARLLMVLAESSEPEKMPHYGEVLRRMGARSRATA